MRTKSSWLIAPSVGLIALALSACATSADDDASSAGSASTTAGAPCTPLAEQEIAALAAAIPSDYSVLDLARRRYLDALALTGPASAVYLDEGDVSYANVLGDRLRAALAEARPELVPLVDAIAAKVAANNLYLPPGSTEPSKLGSGFRCLSQAGQASVLQGAEIDERGVTFSALPPATLERFQSDTEDEVRVWWDTVLEGPYALESDAEVSDVNELWIDDTLVGYRISVSATAVTTESCERDDEDDEAPWPDDCARGTIQQDLYYDADLDRIEAMEEGAQYYD